MRSPGTLRRTRRNGAYPKGVWFQRKRLASGRVVRYGYLGRGKGTVSLGREGEPEFFLALAQASRKEPDAGTLASLIWRYKKSPEFGRLRDRTKADYRPLLDKIQDRFGTLSLAAMADRRMAQHIFEWRDSMGKSPRRADYAIQVLKALLSWGVDRGLIEHNRAAGVGRLHRGDRREYVWTGDQIDKLRDTAPEPIVRALLLALETGQRQGDLLALRWSDIQRDLVTLRQAKTKTLATVPISPALQALLNRTPKSNSGFVLTTSSGEPWDAKGNGFRSAWRKACRRAGVRGVTFHDLRGTFVTHRLAAGWTREEVAMCTGHSLRDLSMLDHYADRASVAAATAQRIAQRGG